MGFDSVRRSLILGLVGLAALLSAPRAEADLVKAGYDLFQTDSSGTSFMGVQFMGVPLGTYNFGGSIGVQNTGATDTIIQRTQDVSASAGGTGSSPLIMQALQLESTTPVNLGAGTGIYFLTLQSVRGGPASTGTITYNFANPTPGPPPPAQPIAGTFSSSIDVFFDLRFGSINGAIVASSDLVLSNSGAFFSHYPAAGQILINGANSNLNGVDHSNDFFPIGEFTEMHPTGAQHEAYETGTSPSVVPEPSSVMMGAVSLVLVGAIRAWRSRKKGA